MSSSKKQLSGDLFTYCAARFSTIALIAKDKGDSYIQRLAESAVEEMGRRVINGTADETRVNPIRRAVEICEKVREGFHTDLMEQSPGGKRALQFAHLEEGALACKAMLVMELTTLKANEPEKADCGCKLDIHGRIHHDRDCQATG